MNLFDKAVEHDKQKWSWKGNSSSSTMTSDWSPGCGVTIVKPKNDQLSLSYTSKLKLLSWESMGGSLWLVRELDMGGFTPVKEVARMGLKPLEKLLHMVERGAVRSTPGQKDRLCMLLGMRKEQRIRPASPEDKVATISVPWNSKVPLVDVARVFNMRIKLMPGSSAGGSYWLVTDKHHNELFRCWTIAGLWEELRKRKFIKWIRQ